MKSYVYLHGFASSSNSSKAQFFRRKLARYGIVLEVPELDGGDFEHLTISGQLEIVRKAAPSVVIGSSLGGYVAALYAAENARVDRLALLAPAFDLRERWAKRVGLQAVADWKRLGALPVFHYGSGRERWINYEFYEDAAKYPAFPDVGQPTIVMQGVRDEIVPPELAERFCKGRINAELHLLHSGHELTNVLEEMWTVLEPYLTA